MPGLWHVAVRHPYEGGLGRVSEPISRPSLRARFQNGRNESPGGDRAPSVVGKPKPSRGSQQRVRESRARVNLPERRTVQADEAVLTRVRNPDL